MRYKDHSRLLKFANDLGSADMLVDELVSNGQIMRIVMKNGQVITLKKSEGKEYE